MLRVVVPGGSHAVIRPARPGLLLVRARVPASASAGAAKLDLTGMRVLLTSDLLTRVAELSGLQVLATWSFEGDGGLAGPIDSAAALGIHPAAAAAEAAGPGGPADVLVTSGTSPGDGQGGTVITVARAALDRGHGPGEPLAELLAGPDPLAIRFALMSFPHHEPAAVSEDMLAGARETLGRWRHRVAQWAQSPSRAIPENLGAAIRAAFGELDIVAALALLDGLAADDTVPDDTVPDDTVPDDKVPDDTVPAGARLETFLFADRVLGLDLPRDIGR